MSLNIENGFMRPTPSQPPTRNLDKWGDLVPCSLFLAELGFLEGDSFRRLIIINNNKLEM